MTTSLSGRLWKFGDNVCGDDGIIEFSIIREGFGRPFNEEELRTVCFRQIRPEFPSSVKKGDIVVGGRNFAHHNHVEVPAAIKFSGISAVVVESCESGFIRRALNLGLPVVTCPGISAAVADGETLSLDPASGEVTTARGTKLAARPFSPRMLAIWQAGGVVPLLQKEFAAKRAG
jgi:3-isopropylmalate/(R)-2-methylmalate dehydratase small subunit